MTIEEIRKPEPPYQKTHHDTCWRDHHECAIKRIEDLERAVEILGGNIEWGTIKEEKMAVLRLARDRETLGVWGEETLKELERDYEIHCILREGR